MMNFESQKKLRCTQPQKYLFFSRIQERMRQQGQQVGKLVASHYGPDYMKNNYCSIVYFLR